MYTPRPQPRRPISFGLPLLVTTLVLGACGDGITPPTSVSGPQFNVTVPDTLNTTVCKVGPTGEFTTFRNASTGSTDGWSGRLLVTNPYAVASGTCVDVFRGGPGTDRLEISEVAPGVLPDSVVVVQKPPYPGFCTEFPAKCLPVKYTGTETVVLEVNYGQGYTVTYYNPTPPPPPALAITKVADAAMVTAGNPIGFTIQVSSTAGTATGVTLSDPLPGGTGVSWYIRSSDPTCSITGSAPMQTLSCDFGDMAAGSTRTVQVESQTTLQTCSEFPNTATAQAANHAPVQASATTVVKCDTRPFVGCTPGFWQGRNNGSQLWNTQPDPEWTANGGAGSPPFVHGTSFNGFFASHPALAGKTMYDLVRTGGGRVHAQKAARSLVAAYLNTSVGLNTGYSQTNLRNRWLAAVAGGDDALLALHNELDEANNRGSCGLTARR